MSVIVAGIDVGTCIKLTAELNAPDKLVKLIFPKSITLNTLFALG